MVREDSGKVVGPRKGDGWRNVGAIVKQLHAVRRPGKERIVVIGILPTGVGLVRSMHSPPDL